MAKYGSALGAIGVGLALGAWSPAVAAQEAQLEPADLRGAHAGAQVAFMGDDILVAVPGSSPYYRGAARVAVMVPGPDGWEVRRTFRLGIDDMEPAGFALATDGDRLAVGDFRSSDPLPSAGAAAVFGAGEAQPLSILRAPEPRIASLFGAAIDIEGTLMVVGAPGAHVDGIRTGAAYVLRRTQAGWTHVTRLVSPQPRFDGFMGHAALAQGRIVVGGGNEISPGPGRGAVHVFEETAAGQWILVQSIGAPDASDDTIFARQMTVHGELLAVSGVHDGADYVDMFEWLEGSYVHRARLSVRGMPQDSGFGRGIAMNDRVVAIGAPRDRRGTVDSGGVYLFDRTDDSYELLAFVGSPAGGAGDRFGVSVALDETRLLVGAPGVNGDTGAAFLYDVDDILADPPAVFEPLGHGVLPQAGIKAMAQDRDGLLWLAADVELIVYDGHRVERFRHDPGDPTSLPSGLVLSLLLDPGGNHWIGTEHGLARFQADSGAFHRFAIDAEDFPRTSFVELRRDSSGEVWAGTNGRLYRLDPATNESAEVRINDDEPRQRDESYVSGIQVDADGRLWVLAKNLWENQASLYRLGQDSAPALRFELSESWGQTGPFLIDSRNRFWLKAPAPARIPESPGTIDAPPDLAVETHWAHYEDVDGGLWAGTDTGYYHAPPGSDRTGPRRGGGAGLGGRVVLSFLDTTDGGFLVGTSGGVFRRIPFPRTNDTAMSSAAETRLLARQISISGRDGPRSLPAADSLRLGPNDSSVTFQLAAPNFVDPNRAQYRYRLIGHDRDWQEAGESFEITYTNLAPDQYTFEAVATVVGRDGRFADTETMRMSLLVVPPVWERTWFRLVVLAVLAAVAGLVMDNRRRQRQKVQAIRRQIAGDLHDDLSTNLSGIVLSSRMLLEKNELAEPERAALDRIVSTADAMAGDLRDIVWLVDPNRDTADDLEDKMRQVARDLLGDVDCSLSIDATALVNIDMAQRRQLLLMFKEMIHNVARHASAGRVEVTVGSEGHELRLTVQDDGIGFDPRTVRSGHGLSSLDARARALGAELDLTSARGAGTRVEVTFDPAPPDRAE